MGNLTSVQEHVKRETGVIEYSGKCRNLFVRKKAHGTFVGGSFATFKHGVNLPTLRPQLVTEVLEELCESLKVDVKSGRVYRLDVAQDLKVKLPPVFYFQQLGAASRYQKWSFGGGTTIIYKNGLREICLYDKVHQMNSKKVPIPDSYRGLQIIRCEVRYRSRVAQQLNRTPMTVADLSDPCFVRETISRWCSDYSAIEKNGTSN